jgi:hypothetical protein
MEITAYISHLKAQTVAVQEVIILRVMQENEATAVDLNTAQLMGGRDSNGQIFGTYPEGQYKTFKTALNPKAGGNVDLRLTGDFHNSFYLEAKRFPVFFGARDYKTPRLTEKYGEDFFGLTKESQAAYNDQIRGEIQEEYRDTVFLVR